MILTESIQNYVFSLNSLEDCKELTINKLSVDGKILKIDLTDLYNFPNLESLSLCNMTIGEKDFLILETLNKLKKLELYNCDFSNNNLFIGFNNLSIEELIIDNTEIDFSLIEKRYNKVLAKNVKNIYYINCNELDINKAIMVDFKKIDFQKYNKIIVSKTQYLNQKDIIRNNINNIELLIKDDFYDEIGGVYE